MDTLRKANINTKHYFKELRPDFKDELIKVIDGKGRVIKGITIDDVAAMSRHRGYFKCAYCGREYNSSFHDLLNRTTTGCRHCGLYQISANKVNDANSFYAAHIERFGCEPENFKIIEPGLGAMGATAKTISYGSNWKIQVNCARCHATLITSPKAFLKAEGCRHCNTTQYSKPERVLQKTLKKRLGKAVLFNTAADIDMQGRKTNCDCVIKGVSNATPVVIQYDGDFYHKDKTGVDIWVNERCYAAGYDVIRIRAGELDLLPEKEKLHQIVAPKHSLSSPGSTEQYLVSLNNVFNVMNSLGYSLEPVSMEELKETATEIRMEENGIRPSVSKWLKMYDFYVENGGITPMPRRVKIIYEGQSVSLHSRFERFLYETGLTELEKNEFKKRGLPTERFHRENDEKVQLIIELIDKHSAHGQKINRTWMTRFGLTQQYNSLVNAIKLERKTLGSKEFSELLQCNFYMPNNIPLKDWLLANRPEQYAAVMALSTTAA